MALFKFILVFLITWNLYGYESPRVQKGVIDLTRWKGETINLDGEWIFHWKRFLNPYNLKGSLNGDLIKVPGPWYNSYPRFGYATYVLKIKGLKKSEIDFRFNENFSAINAYAVYPNKVIVLHRSGKVGKNKKEEIPHFSFFVNSMRKENSSFYLVIHLSNFHYRYGKLSKINLGMEGKLKKNRDLTRLSDFFMMGILFVMGIYHLILYRQRKEELATLYFGLLCLFLCIRAGVIGNYFFWFFEKPNVLLFNLCAKINYIGLLLAGFTGILFFNCIFRDPFSLKLKKGVLVFLTLVLPVYIFMPPSYFSQIFWKTLVELYLVILVIIWLCISFVMLTQGKEYAVIVFASMIFIIIGFFYDIAASYGLLPPIQVANFTFFTWILMQSSILSLKFSEAFKKVEALSFELKNEVQMKTELGDALEEARSGLEKVVTRRTAEISSVLAGSNQAFFAFDHSGKIVNPISDFTRELFKKNIYDQKLSNILYPNLKPGMKEFEELRKNLEKVFKRDGAFFNSFKRYLPSKAEFSVGVDSERKVLGVTYSPIFGEKSLVEKVLCLVEDKTLESEEHLKTKDESLGYKIIKEIMSVEISKIKENSLPLKNAIKDCFQLLEVLSSSTIESQDPTQVVNNIKNMVRGIIDNTYSDVLKDENLNIVKEVEHQISFINSQISKEKYVPVSSVLGLSDSVVIILGNLLKYREEMKRFNIEFKLEEEISTVISNTRGLLDSQFSNLIEYTLVIRDRAVEEISDDELERAAMNARTNSRKNFETNIPLIYQKAKQLSLLTYVGGEMDMHKLYDELAESVKLLPKADVVSYHDLRNNLFKPYIQIRNKF